MNKSTEKTTASRVKAHTILNICCRHLFIFSAEKNHSWKIVTIYSPRVMINVSPSKRVC